MKFCLALLAGILLIAFAGEWAAPYRAPLLETVSFDVASPAASSAKLPTTLTAGAGSQPSLRIRTTSAHYALGGHVLIEASGSAMFASLLSRDGAIPLGPGYPRCSAAADARGRWTCRIPFRFEGEGWIDFVASTSANQVHRLEPLLVKASPLAAVGIGSLLALFGGLSALALLLLAVSGPRVSELKPLWLAGLGALWLLATGVFGAALLAVLLAAHYVLLRLQLRRAGSQALLAAALLLLVTVLVEARIGIPWLWRQFADPGGLQIGVPLGFAFVIIRAADLSLRAATHELHDLPPREYFTYMLFPATLAAGPIMTLAQFRSGAIQNPTIVDWAAGAARIAIGISKKVVGDLLLARIAGPKLALLYFDPDGIAAGDLMILLLANAAYVYLDFSAYSDIAIGVARQLGWRVPENFEFPFVRSSMRAFWQSWHITLSAWVARWIHFFCSFNLRRSPAMLRSGIPVVASLLIIGLWHEMQLSWIFWGLHHALGILIGDALRTYVPRNPSLLPRAALRVGGIAFVWIWVALSHCFTLISDPALAAGVYLRLLAPWAG